MDNYRRESALEVARRHPQSLSEGFRNTRVFGTDCTGAIKLEKKMCEAERKRRERKAKTNGRPVDSMTKTCSTCNRQFRARIGLISHQRTNQHIEIMMFFLISERRTANVDPTLTSTWESKCTFCLGPP